MPLIKFHELKIKFEMQVENLEVDKMANRQNGQLTKLKVKQMGH